MPKPKISIIIPSHNYGHYLGQCLTSVSSQTLKPSEVLVIDDASEDDTSKVVQKFPEAKYYKVNLKNGNKTRNFGFEKSSGDYLVFFDADNYMRRNFLENLYEVLSGDPEAAFAYCDRYNVPVGDMSWHSLGPGLWRSRSFHPNLLMLNNYIDLASLIRREFFPGFDEDLKRLQDWDLWLSIVIDMEGRGVYVPEPLFFYRIHEDSVTGREDLEQAHAYIFRKYGRKLFPYNHPLYWILRNWAVKLTDLTGTTPAIRKVKRRVFDSGND